MKKSVSSLTISALLWATILTASISVLSCATTGSSAKKPESAAPVVKEFADPEPGTPVDIFDAIKKKNIEALNAFIAQGVNLNKPVVVDAKYGTTETPLICVLKNGPGLFADNIPEGTRVLMVETLLKAGADPNVKDDRGWNSWIYALRCGMTNGKVEKILLDAGVDILPIKEMDGIFNDSTGTARSFALANYPDRPNLVGMRMMMDKGIDYRVAAEEVCLDATRRENGKQYLFNDKFRAEDAAALWEVYKELAHRCFVAEAAKPSKASKAKAANKGALVNTNNPLLYSIAMYANRIPYDVLKIVLDDAVATGVDFGIKDERDFTAYDQIPYMPTKYSSEEDKVAAIYLPSKYQLFLEANRRAAKPCAEGENIIGLRIKAAN